MKVYPTRRLPDPINDSCCESRILTTYSNKQRGVEQFGSSLGS